MEGVGMLRIPAPCALLHRRAASTTRRPPCSRRGRAPPAMIEDVETCRLCRSRRPSLMRARAGRGGGGPSMDPLAALLPAVLLASAAITVVAQRPLLVQEVLLNVAPLNAPFSLGDTAAVLLWSASLWFVSPWQLLLLFLGKVETERPSDWLLSRLAAAAGIDTSSPSYAHPPALVAAAGALTLLGGAGVAGALTWSLQDATWGVSTGIGSLLLAGVYEVGRPKRLSPEEAEAVEARWRDFVDWADVALEQTG